MEIRVILPENEPPATVKEVVTALKSAKLKPQLQNKDWGNWIVFDTEETVISIESNRGLTSSATIEYEENDWNFVQKITSVFIELGWLGEDHDGPYQL